MYFRWRFYYEDYTPQLKDTYHVEWQFGHIEYAPPSPIPSLCTRPTRAGIEWCCLPHRA